VKLAKGSFMPKDEWLKEKRRVGIWQNILSNQEDKLKGQMLHAQANELLKKHKFPLSGRPRRKKRRKR
jgi:hypothetical protein